MIYIALFLLRGYNEYMEKKGTAEDHREKPRARECGPIRMLRKVSDKRTTYNRN